MAEPGQQPLNSSLLDRVNEAPFAATGFARDIDLLFFTMLGISTVVMIGIVVAIVLFYRRYRREQRPADRRAVGKPGQRRLEWLWSSASLLVFLGFFVWGAVLYLDLFEPPDDALQIRGLGKQWMWKFYHPDGRREINQLHLPVGRPIEVVLTSEDVIHSFYVPAFRIKQDAVPGRYTRTHFVIDEPGTYRLFCAEYCGTDHSAMRGFVEALTPGAYQQWLARHDKPPSLATRGMRLYRRYACVDCHGPDGEGGGTGRAPVLQGLAGSEVTLQSGETVRADEAYLRRAIMRPEQDVVAGYAPVMPSYASELTEEQVVHLIAYIKSLANEGPNGPAGQAGGGAP